MFEFSDGSVAIKTKFLVLRVAHVVNICMMSAMKFSNTHPYKLFLKLEDYEDSISGNQF